MATQTAFAKTPSLKRNGLPTRGKIRETTNGELFYLNPMTEQYESAVRLRDIRQRVIQGNGQSYTIPKKHGNEHGRESLNYTSFLPQDQSYGPSRADRHPILFQLKPVDFGAQPTGYVRDNGHIVLDAFNHGIRDFGNAMPLCLSTEVEGHDIETYKRRNMQIALYDIIARMPGGYWTGKRGNIWRNKPPRAGSVSMRATRFRLGAGCLTWNEKGDSDAKNSAMMSLMPAAVRTQCENINSTISFRDLSKAEQTQCKTATGHRPAKASKANRARKAEEDEEDSYDVGDADQDDDAGANEYEYDEEEEEATRPITRPIAKPTTRKSVARGLATANKKVKHGSSKPTSKGQQPKQGRKRTRNDASSSGDSGKDVREAPAKYRRTRKGEESDESSSEYELALIEHPIIRGTRREAPNPMQSSRKDAESAMIFGEAIANALKDSQSTSDVGNTHESGYLFVDEEQDGEGDPKLQTSIALTQSASRDSIETGRSSDNSDKKGVILNVKPGSRLPKRHFRSDGGASGESGHSVAEEKIQDAGEDEEADTIRAPQKSLKRPKRSTARKGPMNTKLADTMRSATRDASSPDTINGAALVRKYLKRSMRSDTQKSAPYAGLDQITLHKAQPSFADVSQAPNFLDFSGGTPYGRLEQISRNTPHTTFSSATQIPEGFELDGADWYFSSQLTPPAAEPASVADAHGLPEDFELHTNTFVANVTQDGEQEDFALNNRNVHPPFHGDSAEVDFDPYCEGFQSETAAGIQAGDFRYVLPMGPEDIKIIDRVLELSRADFYQKTGHRVPANILNDYKGENYTSQQRRLDAHFENERIEAGNDDGESIYCVPEWFGGFNNPAWWNALDEEGKRLEDLTQDYDF